MLSILKLVKKSATDSSPCKAHGLPRSVLKERSKITRVLLGTLVSVTVGPENIADKPEGAFPELGIKYPLRREGLAVSASVLHDSESYCDHRPCCIRW